MKSTKEYATLKRMTAKLKSFQYNISMPFPTNHPTSGKHIHRKALFVSDFMFLKTTKRPMRRRDNPEMMLKIGLFR